MSRNAILVVNLDDSMHPHTRESIRHAASRWGCQYIEMITRPPEGLGFGGIYLKCWAFHLAHRADRILCLDSDILIREDAPNPFELFPDPNKFYAVKDYQPSEELRLSFKAIHQDLGGGEFDYEKYFNAGVVLMSRPFQPALEKNLPVLTKYFPKFWYDQHLLNILAQRSGGLELISSQWNFFSFQKGGPMEAYIYHWAGRIIPGKVLWRKQ